MTEQPPPKPNKGLPSNPRGKHRPTALATWMRGLAAQLRAEGMDVQTLFAQCGLDAALLEQADARYPVESTTRLWQLAVARTGDEALGLKAIRHITPSHFHFVGMSVLASRTLEEAFERLTRLADLVTDASQMTIERLGELFEVRIELREGAQPAHQSTDGLMALLANSGKGLGAPHLKPVEVHLLRPTPGDPSLIWFDRTFDTQVRYNMPCMKLIYRTADVQAPLAGANPTIADHLTQAALAAIDRLKPALACTDKVRQAITDYLHKHPAQGFPPAEQLARAVHMSSRNLQRKLAEEGSSVAEIVDEIKKDMAHQRLTQGQDPITAVALDLGFSDASAFSRACKRWFGLSPSQLRQQTLGD